MKKRKGCIQVRELPVEPREERGEDGAAHRFEYYVLVDQMEVNGGFACESYGVRVAESGETPESVSVPNITTSASRIDELVSLLTRNSVGPAGLNDVLADWL